MTQFASFDPYCSGIKIEQSYPRHFFNNIVFYLSFFRSLFSTTYVLFSLFFANACHF